MYHRWDQVIKDLLIYSDNPPLAWNYIAAIRGPDNGNELLKDMLTAVVRGDTMENGSIGMPIHLAETVDDESWYTNKLMAYLETGRQQIHYIDHARWGLGSLGHWYHMQKEFESENLIGSFVDRISLICYRHDEESVRPFVRKFLDINNAWEGYRL